jgi:hypothetical protein
MKKSKKPWPSDAVMIVSADARTEKLQFMESTVPRNCRVCDKKLMACTFSIRRGEAIGRRTGRPVKFFCVACAVQHDIDSLDILEDHRGTKNPSAIHN